MTNRTVAPSKALGYSDLYLDFLAGKSPAREFYLSSDISEIARRIDQFSYRRTELVEILSRQNREYGADAKAFESIQKLSHKDTLCVFAGQQAGLFTGPMLVLVKALAIVKLAGTYSAQLRRPVVPIFWIAGDDHDFDEISSTWVLNQQSELVELKYGTRPVVEVPAAEMQLSDVEELNRLKQLLRDSLGQSDFTDELYGAIDSAYSVGESFVSAFGKLMARLTSGTGLAFFNPGDAEAKELAVPFFEKVVDSQPAIHRSLAETNRAIVAAGYHLQVEKKENAALLFRNVGNRRPIYVETEGFSVGSDRFSAEKLKSEIRSHPVQFSPDVMTRPVMQSFLFPVVSQIGGPAEIAYLAQSNRLFEVLDVPTPLHRGRPSVTLVEKRIEKSVDEYNLSFDDLTGDIEQVVNRVMAATFPKDMEQGYADLTSDLAGRWNQFVESSLKFDPSLEDFARQTFGKIDFALKGFESKLFSSHKKKGRDIRERIYRVQLHLFPKRTLQERTINIACFVARHGFGVVSYMQNQMEADQTAHQIIALSEMPPV